MKFPTYEEMGQEVANRVLDEYEYNGKTLRQWIEIISATDINVGTKDGTNLAEVGTDLISRQAAIDAIDVLRQEHRYKIPGKGETYSQYNEAWQDALDRAEGAIGNLPSAEPEHTCVNCGRTANNGGWYADGRTRCPIEEHYALPKDGYCHLWEKRNVTDDDYPERREEPHWIPVTERLPEKEGRYLVTNSKIGAWLVDVDFYRPYMGGWMYDQGVTAWMPKPEPYKGVTE